jgi:hypothetical protein
MTDLLTYTYDPDTLHEIYADPDAVQARVETLRVELRDAPDEIAELALRAELVELLRATGALDAARVEGQRAVDRAEIVGTPAQQHTARLRLAHVDQWRGDFAQSNVTFTELLAAAEQFGVVIDAFTHHHAGLNDYDQGHWTDARNHFARALRIHEELELPEAELSRIALAAAQRRLAAQ